MKQAFFITSLISLSFIAIAYDSSEQARLCADPNTDMEIQSCIDSGHIALSDACGEIGLPDCQE